MMSKCLFIYPEHGRRPSFPCAIGYLSAAILQVEPAAKIDVVDLNIEQNKEKFEDESYDYIFVSAISAHFYSVERVIQYVKEHNRRSVVILGGIIVTSMPKKIIAALNADLFVVGEGEITVQELIMGLDKTKINGLGYKDQSGQVIINPTRNIIKSLDTISFPAWHVFRPEYIAAYREADGLWDYNFPVLASRGCPMRCNFCFRNFNGTYRSRGVDNVLDEIELLMKQHKIGVINFIDEYFFANKKRILEFCQRIHNRKMKFMWSCMIRVDLADSDMFSTMKAAGCYAVQIGAEHGSQKMLDAMNKKSTVEDNIRCMKLIRESKMYFGTGIILGYPGETPETIREVDAMLHTTGLTAGIFLIQACPGTPLWVYAIDNGYITDEISYLRDSFNGDKELKTNFTNMPTEYIISELNRITDETSKYTLNSGFDFRTKAYLQIGFYLRVLGRGDFVYLAKRMLRDIRIITHMKRDTSSEKMTNKR